MKTSLLQKLAHNLKPHSV